MFKNAHCYKTKIEEQFLALVRRYSVLQLLHPRAMKYLHLATVLLAVIYQMEVFVTLLLAHFLLS